MTSAARSVAAPDREQLGFGRGASAVTLPASPGAGNTADLRKPPPITQPAPAGAGRSGPQEPATTTARTGSLALVASSASMLALLVLSFIAHITVISAVEHARSQRIAYADLRADLSAVTAPTGQQDVDGQMLELGTPVAILTAPGLGLEREVVFEGTTSGVLAKGPGHRRSSVLPGQAGVAILYGRASAYGGPFGGADGLRKGSPITVTTGQGEHTYRVTGVRHDGAPVPPAPDVAGGEGRLTLVTATGAPFAPDEVVYVDAELTSPAVPAPRRVLGASGLLPAEEALAGDRSTLPTILLLLQGLALAALAMAWASRRWGSAPAWLVGTPVVTLFALLASRELGYLLPNLL